MDIKKTIILFTIITVIILLAFLPASPIYTQSMTHPIGISGFVKRVNGDIVENAVVSIAGQIASTDTNGRFIVMSTGYTGQKIPVSATWNNMNGEAFLTVDLSQPTQLIDITIGIITPNFVFTPTTPQPGDTITFTDKSTGPVNRWKWNLTEKTIEGKQITHVYNNEGTYTVTLTIWDDLGTEKSTTKTVNVQYPPPPVKYHTLTIHTIPDNCSTSVCLAVGLFTKDLVCDMPKSSGELGLIEYAKLTAGTYTVSVGKTGYLYRTLTVDIDSDKTITVDLTQPEPFNPLFLILISMITALILVIIVYVKRRMVK